LIVFHIGDEMAKRKKPKSKISKLELEFIQTKVFKGEYKGDVEQVWEQMNKDIVALRTNQIYKMLNLIQGKGNIQMLPISK
jgi:hypothetical protein